MRIGLENFQRFLEPYGARTTLFMVGNDFRYEHNHGPIRAMARAGHEIANHTLTHPQGFRLLPLDEKEAELAGMEEWCERVLGQRPVGFRSPGWNVGDDAIELLQRRGYLYDSSVHPTSLMPLLKFLHWRTMSSRSAADRTTMGRLTYMAAPVRPYRSTRGSLARRGTDGIVEFPVTVTPLVRLPFFATFLLATGYSLFRQSYRALRMLNRPIQFMFHLSDFVDYQHPEFKDQVPRDDDGVYVPQALRQPLAQRLDLFKRAIDLIAADHEFVTLAEWARTLAPQPTS